MPIVNVECVVCGEVFSNSDNIYSTSCGHIFHFDCIERCLLTQTRSNCPQCRHGNITTHKIYLSFDESNENLSDELNEMKEKLEISIDKVTECNLEIIEADANFLNLHRQYAESEEIIRELKEKLTECMKSKQETDLNFKNLQNQYTESKELIVILKHKNQQLKGIEDNVLHLQEQFVESNEDISELQQINNLLTIENEHKTIELIDLQKTHEKTKQIIRKLQEEVQFLTQENQCKSNELNRLQETHSQLSHFQKEYTTAAEKSISNLKRRNDRLEIKFLQLQKRYEKAGYDIVELEDKNFESQEIIRQLLVKNDSSTKENKYRSIENQQSNDITDLKSSPDTIELVACEFILNDKIKIIEQTLYFYLSKLKNNIVNGINFLANANKLKNN